MSSSHRAGLFDRLSGVPARTLLVALGLTVLIEFWVIKPAVEPSQHALYHWSGSARVFFAPVAIDVFVLWLLLSLLLVIALRPGRTRVAIWSGLLFILPWFLLQNAQFLGLIKTQHELSRILFLGALLATVLLTAYWRPAFAHRFERLVSIAANALFFAGVFGIFLLFRLGWYAWRASNMAERFQLHHAQAAPPIQPHRVIWIVFDELSYQQVFEHRYPGLYLPAFDTLATQSTVFSHVVPAGTRTEVVLPSLISGKPADDIETSPTGQLSIHTTDSNTWQDFDQHNTVFQDALDDGYATGVAGWYNPYCQIIPETLDHCLWSHGFAILNGMVPSGTVLSNALEPVKMLAIGIVNVGPSRLLPLGLRLLHTPLERVKSARLHVHDYELLDSASRRLLRDPSAGFILLHLPVPHPESIYDRKTGKLSTERGTYMDNLALADKCFAGLRATLEQTGQWDSSAIVLMGDHSWRTTQLWEGDKNWTPAEQTASLGGGYDERPVYIVKLPGQTTGSRIDTVFQAGNTRKLFDALLTHKIQSTADLTAWAQAVRSESPPVINAFRPSNRPDPL